MRRVIFFSPNEQRGGRGGRGGVRCQTFFSPLFRRDHEGLAAMLSSFFRVGNQYAECETISPRYYTVDPLLLPSVNPFECHEDVLSLQPMIPPKRFDIFPPVWDAQKV